eukprot:gene27418-36190_t
MALNPEKATDYLARVNWKSFIEWMTAEAILNRPPDILQFCRDLLGEKLAGLAGADFKPEMVTDWLRNCYTEATALVDEHGMIKGKQLDKAQLSLPEQIINLRRKLDGMQKLLDSSAVIASLDPFEATENIIFEACRILDCDRATIFTLDKITQELVLSVAEGAKNIRVPIGQGIAGTVAATGETVNIVDAYSDPRFNSSADKASGYRTTTILCMPIRTGDNSIVGVLQAINKRGVPFGNIDEEVMESLAIQAGIALQNANLYRHAESARDKFRSLLDIIRAMQGEMGVNSLIFTITQRTTKVVDADRCTLYLVDNVNIKISMDQGIAGMVATSGQILNITDAYDNPHFNQTIDKKTGYRTKAILCMPIKSDDTVIGVLQLINKISGGGVFTMDDEDIMNIFLSIAGPLLAESNLYAQIQGKSKGRGVEGVEKETSTVRTASDSSSKRPLRGLAEGGEEDEDD